MLWLYFCKANNAKTLLHIWQFMNIYTYVCEQISLYIAMGCASLLSCVLLCDPMDCSLLGSSVHGDSPGKNTGVGCHTLLQGIFPTQGSNPGLLHCRQILYRLSHQGRWRILEWLPCPPLGDPPDPGIELGSPVLQVDSLPAGLPGKPHV